MPKLSFTGRNYFYFFSTLIGIVFFMLFNEAAFSQEKPVLQKLSVKGTNITLQQAFQQIKKETGLIVFYTNLVLNDKEKVSVNFNNAPLNEVLNYLLKNKNISYQIRRDKVIVLEKKVSVGGGSASKSSFIVKGIIIDVKNIPLPGVIIKQKNGTSTAVSDAKGNYSISVSGQDANLEFTYMGFETQEIAVNDLKNINVVLKEKLTGLDEIVVIGYGTTTKRDLTGAVGTVVMKDLEKAPVRSFEEALAGRVAGVEVSSPDGQPGSASSIVIRGNNSITQDNSPLYVIDGFPLEDVDNNTLNPADIESIEILKDASATAIYGARGANGVIIITTKRGKVGEPVINYNGYYGVQKVIKEIKLMEAYDFVKLQREVNSAGAISIYGPVVDDDRYKLSPGINWQDEVFKSAPMQNNYISINGGTSKTKYSISGSILNQDGIILNTGFNRYQGRVVLDQAINNKLKVGVNLNYSGTDSYGVLASSSFGNTSSLSIMSSIWAYRPVSGNVSDEDLLEELIDPSIEETSDYRTNPKKTAINTSNKLVTNTFFANLFAEYMITKNLKLRITGGVNKSASRRDVFYNSNTYQGSLFSASSKGGPYGSISTVQTDNFLNENTLTYSKVFNKVHRLNLVGGFTYQKRSGNIFGATAFSVPNEELGVYGLDEGVLSALQSSLTESKQASFLGRAMYNYKSKYYATASFRTDGSSRFALGNQWSYFPSGSLAWRFSGEDFMKSLPFVYDAKLRAGYGVTGNNRVTDYAFRAIQAMPTNAAYAFNNGVTPGSVLTALSNNDLKWESTGQFDAGLDLDLFKGRIQFTTDFYIKKTYDLLLNSGLPGSVGILSTFKNIGEVQNRGWEFSLTTVNIQKKDFKWSSNFNISFNKNKVIDLTENQEAITTSVGWDSGFKMPLYIAKKGDPIGRFYGFVWEGVYQKSDFNYLPNGTPSLKDEVATNGGTRASIRPGDVKYKDLNGDGILNSDDYTMIGNPYPIHTGGFSNNFEYKQFDLNVFFQWSYGNDVFNANRLFFEGSSVARSHQNQYASYIDRWSETNQESKNFRVGGQGPYAYSSRVVEDGSYLRLKTVSLGYNLPVKYAKSLKISALRVYSSAQNIYTWTNYSGQDPEVSTKNSALTTGFDYSPFPRALTFTFGLNVTL
ncbi:TonB-dependent receptor [Pedobacter arcticus]|uniref:TonB-dependent receptor n=1 Tax=Pedobacter arcticus TaxID=752140 RepID=UPI0002FC4DCD|nr:TonB-dependent receptor [Pedobacter arcticus]